MSPRLALAVLLLGLVSVSAAEDAGPALGPGARIDLLTAGGVTYRQVVVRAVNAHTLVFMHTGGLASVPLRNLPPEWQARFHYRPEEDVAAPVAPAATAAPAVPVPVRSAAPAVHKDVRFDELLRRFGQPAEIRPEVDLRPKFFQLELGVKNQGRRPSCAIFAVVSALEFQNAELAGRAEKFSEEYLIWATRRSVRRVPAAGDAAAPEDADEGFTLSEVVDALRAYGIPLAATMPDTFGRKISAIEDPPAAVVDEARRHQQVFVHPVPGRDPATRINNLVQALNAGLPVAVGLAWPNYRSLRNAFLDRQRPQSGNGHAVTLVGYRAPSGQLEHADFVFKNSYGVEWGQGGYGVASYRYLADNLQDAVVLEVQTPVRPSVP